MVENGSKRIWFEDLRSFRPQVYVKAGVPSEGLKEGIPLASSTADELILLAESLGICMDFI